MRLHVRLGNRHRDPRGHGPSSLCVAPHGDLWRGDLAPLLDLAAHGHDSVQVGTGDPRHRRPSHRGDRERAAIRTGPRRVLLDGADTGVFRSSRHRRSRRPGELDAASPRRNADDHLDDTGDPVPNVRLAERHRSFRRVDRPQSSGHSAAGGAPSTGGLARHRVYRDCPDRTTSAIPWIRVAGSDSRGRELPSRRRAHPLPNRARSSSPDLLRRDPCGHAGGGARCPHCESRSSRVHRRARRGGSKFHVPPTGARTEDHVHRGRREHGADPGRDG